MSDDGQGTLDLAGPLLRMGQFFFGPSLGRVRGVGDVYALARDLRERGLPVRKAEERLLTQILWCLLQIQHDREETEQHQALALMADLVLAIMEDDDFTIPASASVGGRQALEVLAVQLQRQAFQLDMSLGATIGVHDLTIASADDLQRIRAGLGDRTSEELDSVLTKLGNFLGQGEMLLGGQVDRDKAARHGERLAQARERGTFLLARLLTIPPQQDHAVLRRHIVRRELRRLEVDALGIERIGEEEQQRETRRLLRWTEQDLGVELTDDNKAALAVQLQEIARADEVSTEDDWLSQME